MRHTLRVLDIVPGTSVDGPGLRTSIYFAGCRHHCKGCHNPQSWDFNGGKEMTVEQIMDEVNENGFNVTFSGGDPLSQPIDSLYMLAEAIKDAGLTLWCYTGFTYEHIMADPKYLQITTMIDVLVDGPFIESLRDISLDFRGSANQRLIDMRQSTTGHIVQWKH